MSDGDVDRRGAEHESGRVQSGEKKDFASNYKSHFEHFEQYYTFTIHDPRSMIHTIHDFVFRVLGCFATKSEPEFSLLRSAASTFGSDLSLTAGRKERCQKQPKNLPSRIVNHESWTPVAACHGQKAGNSPRADDQSPNYS